MDPANVSLLRDGFATFGLQPQEAGIAAVVRHLEMVGEWNERVNLTAITDEREMVVKHALDSATAFLAVEIQDGMRVLDVGAGAGFPGVVLKCLRPSIELTMVESLAKRCQFLEAVREEVVSPLMDRLAGYDVVWGRAEDVAHNALFREQFDVVTARAVAELRVLSEYCLPFCRVGGSFLVMKGPGAGEEIAGARKAVDRLGGEIQEMKVVELPEGAGERTLVRIKKVRSTPSSYPRKAGVPSKKPL